MYMFERPSAQDQNLPSPLDLLYCYAEMYVISYGLHVPNNSDNIFLLI